MKYIVEIVDRNSGEVIRPLPCPSEEAANTVCKIVNDKRDDRLYARIVVEQDEA